MARSAATQKRILDAYKILLAEKGLDELSVEDIIRESKLARSTFYRYYRDKYEPIQDLLAEVFGRFIYAPEEYNKVPCISWKVADRIIEGRSYLAAIFHYKGQNSCFELLRDTADKCQSMLKCSPVFSPFLTELLKGYAYASLFLIRDWIIGDMRTCSDADLLSRVLYEVCPQPLREIYGWENTERTIGKTT